MTQPQHLASLTSGPSPGFDQPFDMLEACHQRLQRTLVLLHNLREHLAGHGCDVQAQQAARDVLRYFDQAAPQHHRDEELHVFPALLARGDATVAQVVRRLQREHEQLDAGWAAARVLMVAVAEGKLKGLEAADDASLDAFASLYRAHIATEETLAYPPARELLDAHALAAIGAEMKRRRGGV